MRGFEFKHEVARRKTDIRDIVKYLGTLLMYYDTSNTETELWSKRPDTGGERTSRLFIFLSSLTTQESPRIVCPATKETSLITYIYNV